MAIRFNTSIAPNLPWRFKPKQRAVEVQVGEPTLAHYEAENLSDGFTAGTATFNVTPAKAGVYFNKVACFCFTEQTLAAGERADMPVRFFVDPAIAEDPALDDVDTITLSYTFFPDPDAETPSGNDQTAAAQPASTARPASLD
jgi:cytochrome c oxidase assembly protein subunit 11